MGWVAVASRHIAASCLSRRTAAITDLDATFDHADGQADLGLRLYFDEFIAYLINAPASSAIFSQTTSGLSDLGPVKTIWETIDKCCEHGVDVDGFCAYCKPSVGCRLYPSTK